MPDEIKGTDAVSASSDADSLFYLLKITGRAEIGNRDSDGTVKEFFDEDDIGVIQSTALLQDFNTDEFIEIPGSTNDKWLNGDSSTTAPWGGLNGGQLTITALGIPMSASWSVGATDRETELNAVNAIKTAYESPVPGFGVPFSDQQAWPFWGTQLRDALSTSHNDFLLANNAAQLVAVFQGVIDGKSYVSFPGSNFKFVNAQSSNVIDALNKMYAPTLDRQKSVVDGISTLKDFFTVESFVETQINRTQNIFGPVFSSDTFWNEYKALTNTSNLTSGVAQNFLLIQEITGQLSTGLSFTGLSDTPTGYDDGKILQSTTTGLAWVDMPIGGGTPDSVDDITDLPDNPADGQLITVGCDLYIGCNGEWVKVGADAVAPPPEAPACVSNLEEYNQYTEYKDQFLADNSNASFSAGLNNQTNIHDFIHDVCLFADSNLSQERNTVVIDETTYKWGMFAGDQNINIRAQAFSDSNVGSCTFKEWRSNLPNFPKTNAQETIFIDQDASITGYFECTVAPSQPNCNQVALHLQPDTGETIADKSDNQHAVTTVGDTVVDNTATLFGGGTMNFDGNGDRLEIGDSTTFKFINNYSSVFTIECWVNVEAITTDWLGRRSIPILSTSQASSSSHGFALYINDLGIQSYIFNGSSSNVGTLHSMSDSDILGKWIHLAVTWNGETMCLYVDGDLKSSSTPTTVNVNDTDSNNGLRIGHMTPSLPQNTIPHFNGFMQDVRISKKAVYTNNFTPPTNLLANPC
jgi:hypothetical protein